MGDKLLLPLLLEAVLLALLLLQFRSGGRAALHGPAGSGASELLCRFSASGGGQAGQDEKLFFYTIKRCARARRGGVYYWSVDRVYRLTEVRMAAAFNPAEHRPNRFQGPYGGYVTLEEMFKGMSENTVLRLSSRVRAIMVTCRQFKGDEAAALAFCEELISAAEADGEDPVDIARARNRIEETWQKLFIQGYVDHAPDGYDLEADLRRENPWCCPWMWPDEGEDNLWGYRIPGHSAYDCGRIWEEDLREAYMDWLESGGDAGQDG